MQTVMEQRYITGIFIRELKNRFLCEVDIGGQITVCYVPSSCHLSNFLKLEGSTVLLIPTTTKKARTKYAVFAIPYKKSYIILNTSMANRAVENSLHSRRFSTLGKRKIVIKEHYVEGYKSDLFIKDTETIIEIKSVLSIENDAKFPTVFSERSLEQLVKLKNLLRKGYTVRYMIVSLNPYLKSISISQDTTFYKELYGCLECGMKISAFACQLKSNEVLVSHEIPIHMEGYYG